MTSILGRLDAGPRSSSNLDYLASALEGEIRLGRLGSAVVAIAGEEGSLAQDRDWLCGIIGDIDNPADLSIAGGLPADAKTKSAAAIVGRLLAAAGIEALGLLRGAFAGVFTDGIHLWWFRDQMGFWPLFHASEKDVFVVSDTARACLSALGKKYVVNTEYLEDFFYGRLGSSTETAVQGVSRLRAGMWGRAGSGTTHIRRYWDPEPLVEKDPPRASEVPDLFETLMTRAIDRVLTGTDGLLLSGGIDSPTVAAFAAPRYRLRFGTPMGALTAIYPDVPSVDEEELTRMVANELDMPLHTYHPTASATDDLRKWVSLLDGPVPVISLAETEETLMVARSLGMTSVLSGEWAEYLYDMPKRTLAYLIRQGRWGPARHYWRSLRRADVSNGDIVTRLAKDLAPFVLRRPRALRLMGRNTPAWMDRDRLVFKPRGPVKEGWRHDQAMMLDGPGLGLEADHVVQMQTGVRIRRPFADVDLVEFFLRLPAEIKYPGPGSKPLIRKLMRGKVPDRILDRTDKTLFDEAVVAAIDYGELNDLLAGDELIDGIDYSALRSRLSSRGFDIVEYMWAKDLAAVHAFVDHAAQK